MPLWGAQENVSSARLWQRAPLPLKKEEEESCLLNDITHSLFHCFPRRPWEFSPAQKHPLHPWSPLAASLGWLPPFSLVLCSTTMCLLSHCVRSRIDGFAPTILSVAHYLWNWTEAWQILLAQKSITILLSKTTSQPQPPQDWVLMSSRCEKSELHIYTDYTHQWNENWIKHI